MPLIMLDDEQNSLSAKFSLIFGILAIVVGFYFAMIFYHSMYDHNISNIDLVVDGIIAIVAILFGGALLWPSRRRKK